MCDVLAAVKCDECEAFSAPNVLPGAQPCEERILWPYVEVLVVQFVLLGSWPIFLRLRERQQMPYKA